MRNQIRVRILVGSATVVVISLALPMMTLAKKKGSSAGGEATCGYTVTSDLDGISFVESFPLSGCTSPTSSSPRVDFTDVAYDLTSFAANVDVDDDGNQINEMTCFFADVIPRIVSETFSTFVMGSNNGLGVLVGCHFHALGSDGVTVVNYRLLMDGLADGEIPPAPGATTTVILNTWEVQRMGGPGKNSACEGTGFFPLSNAPEDLSVFGFSGPVTVTVFGPPQ